ncbi:MAG: TonB-dependent receptor, partial [Calditrichales bacterium]|nr:TonB-dependent receptor [Calditrichales bacterium]
EGTYLGAATDVDGYFQILNIPASTYIAVVSYVGYSTKKFTDIKILPDYTHTLHIELSPELMKGEVIVVTAERPLIQKDVTSTIKEVSAEEIRHSPVANFTQIIAQQIGAIETGRGRRSGGIHIRGGRNNEIVFYVDGVNSNDPFVGAAGINIDNNAIEQLNIISGGFNAEYGESMSGVVQIITKSGSPEKFTFQTEATSDAMFSGTDLDFGYNKYFASINGPVIGLRKNNGNFYIQGNYIDTRDRNPAIIPQGHNDQQQINTTAKLSFEPIPSVLRVQLNGSFTDREHHSYDHARSANPFWLNRTRGTNAGDNRLSMTISHTLSNKTWYDITLIRFNNFTNFSAENHSHYTEWRALCTKLDWVSEAENQGWYNRETGQFTGVSEEDAFYYYYSNVAKTSTGDPYVTKVGDEWVWLNKTIERDALNNRYYDAGSWYLGDDGELHYREFNVENYSTFLSDPNNPAYEDYDYSGDIDAFAYPYPRDPLGNYILNYRPRWHERENLYYQGEFSLSSQFNKFNLMKIGGWVRKYELSYTDIQFLNVKPYFDTYDKESIEAAFYIQDKYEFEDLSINAGVRWDYFDPDSYHPKDLEDLDVGFEKTKPKSQFSPRFGIAFAVSSEAKMYAHYGKFFQRIDLSDLFQNLNADITNGLPLIGNPNLPPQKETSYEAGFETALANNISLKISAYYKDVENLLSTDIVNTIHENSIAQYTIYLINDFAKIKGFEVELKKRLGPLSGSMTYGFLDAKGTGSDSRDFYYLYLNEDSELPRKEFPLDFDITHDFKGKFNYYFNRESGPSFLGFNPLSDLNLNIFFTFSTGAAYTPTDNRGNPLEVGSGRLPVQNRLDLRIDKYFHPWKNLELDFFIDIRNLFDVRNIVNVYTRTGKPDDNGGRPIWDPENAGAYAEYEDYGYNSAYDMYLADVSGWKTYVKNPASYGMPRIFNMGLMLKF